MEGTSRTLNKFLRDFIILSFKWFLVYALVMKLHHAAAMPQQSISPSCGITKKNNVYVTLLPAEVRAPAELPLAQAQGLASLAQAQGLASLLLHNSNR